MSADVRLDDPRLDRNTLLFASGLLKGAHDRIGGQRSARVLQGLYDRLTAEVARRDKEAASRPSNGVDMITTERERQVSSEGWTAEHDDAYRFGELAKAAACYAVEGTDAHVVEGFADPVDAWPWARERHERERCPKCGTGGLLRPCGCDEENER